MSAKEQELLQIQRGVVRQRALRPMGIWRNWRFSFRHRLRVLDEAQVADGVPAHQVPACAACESKCCANPRSLVSLRLLDVARLRDAGLEHAIASSDPKDAPNDEVRAAIEKVQHLDTWHRFPMLQKRSDGRCVLLDEHGRCSAYDARPLQCRAFPFLLANDLRSVSWAESCRFMRHDGTASERAWSRRAAFDSYHEKLKDLLTLLHASDVIEERGLLPKSESP